MTYTPTSIYKVMDVRSVRGVAIGRRHGDDAVFLFTGGTRPTLVYLTGPQAGRGFDLVKAKSEPFLVVDEIEFEVDHDTMFRSVFVEQPGALLITDRAIGIKIVSKDSFGFDNIGTVYFDNQNDGESEVRDGEFGFKNWRAIKRVSDDKIEIISFAATRVMDH